ncbi:MAG: ABC transporter substrate-binding protein, partial [Armatimonadota bacterium]
APFLPRITTQLIGSAKALREHANDPAWFRSNAVGRGPYMLEQFVPRDRMVLRRFDGYWGPKPFFARAILLDVPEPASQALLIERGEVDIAYQLPPQSLAQMKRHAQLRVLQVPGDRVMNFRMNVSYGPFTKLALRKAVAYAMDYEALLKARLEEFSAPEGPVPRMSMGGWVPPNLITKQDLEKARQLLGEAGVAPGDLEVRLNIAAGTGTQATAAEVVQASLQKIGIRSRISAVEFAPMDQKLQRFARTKNPADAEDTMTLIRGPFIPHAAAYFTSYDPDYLLRNWFGYRNDRAQQQVELGYTVERRDPERATEHYRRAIEMIVTDQPDLWLYVEKKIAVLRNNIQGYYMHPVWFPETHVFPLSRR